MYYFVPCSCNQIDSKRKTMASPRVSLLLLVSLVFFAALSAAESLYATGLSESFYDTSCPQATSIVDAFVTKYLQKDRNFAGAFNRLQFHDCWVGVCLSRPFCEWNVSLSLYWLVCMLLMSEYSITNLGINYSLRKIHDYLIWYKQSPCWRYKLINTCYFPFLLSRTHVHDDFSGVWRFCSSELHCNEPSREKLMSTSGSEVLPRSMKSRRL